MSSEDIRRRREAVVGVARDAACSGLVGLDDVQVELERAWRPSTDTRVAKWLAAGLFGVLFVLLIAALRGGVG